MASPSRIAVSNSPPAATTTSTNVSSISYPSVKCVVCRAGGCVRAAGGTYPLVAVRRREGAVPGPGHDRPRRRHPAAQDRAREPLRVRCRFHRTQVPVRGLWRPVGGSPPLLGQRMPGTKTDREAEPKEGWPAGVMSGLSFPRPFPRRSHGGPFRLLGRNGFQQRPPDIAEYLANREWDRATVNVRSPPVPRWQP